MIPKRVMLLFSGGMDSAVLLYELLSQNCSVHCLGFDYGQKHLIELHYAHQLCRAIGVGFTQIKLPPLKGSAITDGGDSVIVRNRNAILLSIASGIASSQGAEAVLIGCNKSDAEMFPDCRPEFIAAMNAAVKAADISVEIAAPYLALTKRDIALLGRMLSVPIALTWSCYFPVDTSPCGKCPACLKRSEALCG